MKDLKRSGLTREQWSAMTLYEKFEQVDFLHDVGNVRLNMSGCINACAHHHVGHIGILGLDRAGVENYQITLGGDHRETAKVGDRVGPGFSADDIVPAVERIVDTYLDLRTSGDEAFIDTYNRTGLAPFKAAPYPEAKVAAE